MTSTYSSIRDSFVRPKGPNEYIDWKKKINKWGNSNINIVTHDGVFHCDDVCACAMIQYILDAEGVKDCCVVRSRDRKVIEGGQFVVDVGFVYDPDNNRFDHHQKGCYEVFKDSNEKDSEEKDSEEKEELKKKSIPLSSVGMVYKKYGKIFIERVLQKEDIDEKLLDKIYNDFYYQFVQEVDAIDNGVKQTEDGVDFRYRICTNISSIVSRYNRATSIEKGTQLSQFGTAMRYVIGVMSCIINDMYYRAVEYESDYKMIKEEFEKREYSSFRDSFVRPYRPNEYPNLLVFDSYPVNLLPVLFRCEEEFDRKGEIKLVVYPNYVDGEITQWNCRTISVGFTNRHLVLPKDALEKDIDDIVFVHNNRFIGACKTKEGAVKMAVLSLK